MTRSQKKIFDGAIPEPNSGCWLWLGSLKHDGYSTGGQHARAYEAFHGPIPRGLEIDHLCNVPSCVNPDHMEVVTHSENMKRRFARERGHDIRALKEGHCARGHDLAITRRASGHCKCCESITKRERRIRRKGAE